MKNTFLLTKVFPKRLMVVAVITAIVLLVGIYVLVKSFDEKKALTKLLSGVNIEKLYVDGTAYSINNGRIEPEVNIFVAIKVLRLAAFYQWNKEDPLFYSPDLDAIEFRKTVNGINDSQQKYLTFINERVHIYPTYFLKSFGEVALLTQDFFNNPNTKKAEELVAKQMRTSSLYQNEANDLVEFIGRTNPNVNFSPVTLATTRSIKTIKSSLFLVAKNGEVLQDEISKREQCLKGKGNCFRPSSKFDKPTNYSIDEPKIKVTLLDKKLIFAPLATYFDEAQVKGPYRAKTQCFGWGDNFTAPEHYFYIMENGASTNIELATEMYFRKIVPNSPSPDERLLKASGINYLYASSSAFYYCDNNEYMAEISEISSFLSKNKPVLSVQISSEKDFNYERQFFNSKYPSYDDLEDLAKIYGYIYVNFSGKDTLLKDELLRRYIVITRKLGYFERTLSNASNIIQYNIVLDSDNGGNHTFARGVLYPFRNFYGTMYLPFSPSVFRIAEKPSYVDKVLVKNSVILDGSYMSYSQAVTKYSNREILSWFTTRPLFLKKF